MDSTKTAQGKSMAQIHENGNKPWDSIKEKEFPEQLSDNQLLKKDPALVIYCH
jgi:hypothetical protein